MALKKGSPEEIDRQVESRHQQYVDAKMTCSERVFLTVYSVLDTEFPAEVVALLTGFGGGVGGTHASLCGAVAGGVAAIGSVYGRRKPAEESRDRAYEVARAFLCEFKSKFGSEVCGELLGDLLRKNGFDSDERKERCFQYTLNAAKMCVKLLSS